MLMIATTFLDHHTVWKNEKFTSPNFREINSLDSNW